MTVPAVAASGLVVLSSANPASAVTFTNACVNSAVPTDATQLDVTLTGNAPASVEPGASFQLTGISQTLALPGALFLAGYNLGLLQVGSNTVPGTIKTVIEGTGTVEGTQTTPATAISVTFTITDPDGTPGTGDETATDASVTVNYPDQTWTAGNTTPIEFREDTVTPLSTTVGGIVITATIGGAITVRFGCDPGTVGAGGLATDITLVDPAATFASTTVAGAPTTLPTTTTTAPATTTTTAPTTTTTTPTARGERTTVNACKNSVTGTYSDLAWTFGGLATFDPGSGDVTLTESTIGADIPATLLIAGYNVGLLTVGVNELPTTVYVARSARDFLSVVTTQVDHFTMTATTTISDPDGVPGSGDESATPLAVNHSLPDMVAIPAGGGVTFAQAAPGTIGSVPLGVGGAPITVNGSIFVQATVGGVLKVNFDCSPGSTIIDPPGGTTGTTFSPGVPLPFVVLSLTGAAPPPLSPLGASVGGNPLARTGLWVAGPIALALGLLGAGYLIEAAASPVRRRRGP